MGSLSNLDRVFFPEISVLKKKKKKKNDLHQLPTTFVWLRIPTVIDLNDLSKVALRVFANTEFTTILHT